MRIGQQTYVDPIWTCHGCGKSLKIPGLDVSRLPLRCRCGSHQVSDDRGPGFFRRGLNFARAATMHALRGAPHASQETIDARLAICQACDFYNGQTCTHKDCGCNAGRTRRFLNKLAWADQQCPIGKWRPATRSVDILLPLHGTPNDAWWYIRGECVVQLLRENGFSAEVIPLAGTKSADVRQMLATYNPRLFINRAFAIGVDVIREVARDFPQVRFLTVNHSSQSDLLRNTRRMTDQVGHIHAAQEFDNCYYGVVDERNFIGEILKSPKCVWVPNCVPPMPDPAPPASREKPVVSLICRYETIKNIPNQLLALAYAGGVKARLVMKNAKRTAIDELAQTLGLDYEWAEWSSWPRHIYGIRDEVDVGLQCSFSESFNYVALEHLLLGKPVIGSPAIRYLPDAWQVNPDDPRAIAECLRRMIESIDADSQQAAATGAETAKQQNRSFITVFSALLS